MYEPTLVVVAGEVQEQVQEIASTGLVVGALSLFILGGLFTVAAVVTLLKRNSIHRP